MKLARVIGHVVASIKIESHTGRTLLLVQPLDLDGAPCGACDLAIDGAQAGVGDCVLVCYEGKSARLVMHHETAPCEAIVVGVVDQVQVAGRSWFPQADTSEG